MPSWTVAMIACSAALGCLLACDDQNRDPRGGARQSGSEGAPSPSTAYDPSWRRPELSTAVAFDTTMGTLRCELDPRAPEQARRRFEALVRGEVRYRTREGWVKRPAYDGAAVSRVAAGKLALVPPRGAQSQPSSLPDAAAQHHAPGLMSLGPDGTLALTAGAAPELDRAGFVPLGSCKPSDGIEALTRVSARFGRPSRPPTLERVRLGTGP